MISSLRMNLNFLAGSSEEEISANRWRQIVQLQQKANEESHEKVVNSNITNSAALDLAKNYHSDNSRTHQSSKSNDMKKPTISSEKNKEHNTEVSKMSFEAD